MVMFSKVMKKAQFRLLLFTLILKSELLMVKGRQVKVLIYLLKYLTIYFMDW